MLLADDQLEALRSSLGIAGEADDLQRAYSGWHPFVRCVELALFEVTPGKVSWQIALIGHDGQSLLECPIARSIGRSRRLYGSPGETGLVAVNDLFLLRGEFQRSGLGTQIYEAEDRLYRRWRVREVHLEAAQAGREVWVKSRFGMRLKDAATVEDLFRLWTNGATPPVAPADYPPAFLYALGALGLYKELRDE